MLIQQLQLLVVVLYWRQTNLFRVNIKNFLHSVFTKSNKFPFRIVRPTEIPESDVYVCESTYDESKKLVKRNMPGNGLRKFSHSQLVTPDEIYHFKNHITPIKVRL